MKRTLRHLALIALVSTTPLLAEVQVTKFVPADTILIGRIDVAAVRGSALASAIMDQYGTQYGNICTFFNQFVGFDPGQISGMWLLSSQKDTGVAIFQGTFDSEEIRSRFGILPNVTEMYVDGAKFAARFKDEKKNKMQFGVVLDEHTLALGDEPSVYNFLDAWQGKKATVAGDNPQLRMLAASNHHLTATMMGDLTRWKDMDKNVAAVVQSIGVTADVREDLVASLKATATSEKTAEGVEQVLRGVLILVNNGVGDIRKPMVKQALETAIVGREGATVSVSIKVDGDAIQRLIVKR